MADERNADGRQRRDAAQGRLLGEGSAGGTTEQTIPLNVFESEDDIVLVCPMPGVEADNIDIEILGNTVSLRASLRGVGQANRRYLLHEWSYGSYARTFHLPVEVDAERANASHSNGVLVLTLPKAERSKTVRIPLTRVNSREATHRGHSGRRDTRATREG